MYLSRIEMIGFKSFADKTVIEFDKGMTAVVGPNGSGKSNLSEAIRWVFGEQSAKSLRGNRMEDVIFNGTQQRKPVNMAKVTLILNNEDRYLPYDVNEISITRSYHRNGDSQYYINQEPVRMKDVVELLLDSGLGKNSFAMISQGKVETIFLNKPEERRSIFEEAAGVQKYQLRKVEAERKLTKSSDHLSRVKDIIHEIEGQLRPLRKQRDAALAYQEYHGALKQLEVSLYCYQIRQYKEQWEQAKQLLATSTTQSSEVELMLTQLNEQIQQEQEELERLLQQTEEQTQDTQSLALALERLRSDEQVMKQKLDFYETNEQERQVRNEEAMQQVALLTTQLSQKESLHQEVSMSLQQSNERLKQLEHSIKQLTGEQSGNVDEMRNQMIEFYQQEATATNEIQFVTQQLEQQRNRLNQVAGQLETQQQQEEIVQQQLTESQQHQQTLHHDIVQIQQQVNQQKQQVQHIMNDIDVTRKALFQSEREQQSAEFRLVNLRSAQEEYAGYYAGVKAVMTHKQQLSGIKGTVAEIISVREPYQMAIEQALGAAMQHIVVTDDKAAREAIQYLKQQRAGRATFLPMTSMRKRDIASQILTIARNTAGYIGVANEVVDYDQSYDTVMRQLLGATIICDILPNAQKMAKALQQQVRIVTLEGDVLMPGGSLTGGQNKQAKSSVLSRHQEIDDAQQLLERVIQHHQQLENKLAQLEQTAQQEAEQLTQIQVTLQDKEREYSQLEQQLQLLQQQQRDVRNKAIILQDDSGQWESDIAQLTLRLEAAQQQQLEAKQMIVTLTETLAQQTLSDEERQSQLETLECELTDVRTQVAVIKVQKDQLTSEIANISEQLEQRQQWLYNANHATQATQVEKDELLNNLAELQRLMEEQTLQLQQFEQLLVQLKESRQHLTTRLREHELEHREVTQHQQAIARDVTLQEIQVAKYSELIDHHLDYLSEHYQLSYDAAVESAEQIEDDTSVAQEVTQLKRKIDRLGPINLAAIEDCAQLEERYGFLLDQQEDLVTAMTQLQETMDEMDDEVMKRFSVTFEQINQQFQRTFRKLFGGGEAALVLTDPEDLLTTGVDIIAQPPGKRKQALALLSGGERAFTAIALLFAILETKPVPFCVLDEVEAALDEANVSRYGQYIQRFAKDTQFIVITHRKGTMESADVLYGVTMEQSGISKLASVRLSEATKSIEKGERV